MTSSEGVSDSLSSACDSARRLLRFPAFPEDYPVGPLRVLDVARENSLQRTVVPGRNCNRYSVNYLIGADRRERLIRNCRFRPRARVGSGGESGGVSGSIRFPSLFLPENGRRPSERAGRKSCESNRLCPV